MEDFLQMVPSDFYRAKKRPELVLYKVVGEMQFNQDKIDLVFEEGIRLPEQLPQFGNPEDLVCHIVEITSNQVLFSYFPVFFADHEDHQDHDDCFIQWCLKVNKHQTEISQSLITKTRIQFSILNESNFNAKFPKPFDSKYPL